MDNPSLSQLQQLLSNRSQEADNIKSDVEKARELLTSCDQRLQKLVGGLSQKDTQKSLRVFIKNVLNGSNEPLTVKEIMDLVLENGYKTSSTKNFRNIVQQCIINDTEFKRRTKPKTRPSRYALEERDGI